MAQTYDDLAEYVLKERGWTVDELIYVTPISVPEMEAVFPDTQFFRGGGRRKYMTEVYLEQGISAHSLVAVRGGQAYPLHEVAWSDDRTNNGFLAFNRLLRDSGIAVTPENEAVIAKAVVTMLMFYDYESFFDKRNYDVLEKTIPADYRLGETGTITVEEAKELWGKPFLFDGYLRISLPSWTSQEKLAGLWRVAFLDGQVSYAGYDCMFQDVEITDFKTYGLVQSARAELCQELHGYDFRLTEN